MPTLSELKQKESGFVNNPENLQVLSKEDLRKIAPPKEETNSGQEFFNNEMDDLSADLNERMQADEEQYEEEYKKNEEIIEDAVFDAPVEDIDTGLMTEEEADKALSDAFKNAVSAIEEDPNVKAGIEAVESVGKNTVAPENMKLKIFLAN